MRATSPGLKSLRTRSRFHQPVAWSINILTLEFTSKTRGEGMVSRTWGGGSYASPPILIFSLLPTLHPTPFCRKCLAFKILLHTKDGLLPSLASKKPSRRWCFSFKIRATKEFELVRSRYPCLASSARLNTSKSLNHILPVFFGAPNLTQLIHGTCPWLDLCSHKN
jgi:hypothetical protein